MRKTAIKTKKGGGDSLDCGRHRASCEHRTTRPAAWESGALDPVQLLSHDKAVSHLTGCTVDGGKIWKYES